MLLHELLRGAYFDSMKLYGPTYFSGNRILVSISSAALYYVFPASTGNSGNQGPEVLRCETDRRSVIKIIMVLHYVT